MDYETKVDLVANNYAEDFLKDSQATVNRFVRKAFKEGFILGVKKAHKDSEWYHRAGVHGVVYCRNCEYMLKMNDTPFCPNCGSKMKQAIDEP